MINPDHWGAKDEVDWLIGEAYKCKRGADLCSAREYIKEAENIAQRHDLDLDFEKIKEAV